MKKFSVLLPMAIAGFMLSIAASNAQTLKPGYYVTDDGSATRQIEILSDGTIKAAMSAGYDINEQTSGSQYKGKYTVIEGDKKPASKVFYLQNHLPNINLSLVQRKSKNLAKTSNHKGHPAGCRWSASQKIYGQDGG